MRCAPHPALEATMNDPIAILKRDHREAAALLKQLSESKPGATRRRTTDKVVAALRLHMAIEEELLYPLVAERVGSEEEQEAEIEHNLARTGLEKMTQLVDAPGFGAAVAMVTAGIKHHVKEEETEVFPELKSKLDRDELAELGDAVVARKSKSRRRAA
jgi:hemerythrin-like domain-containing protein